MPTLNEIAGYPHLKVDPHTNIIYLRASYPGLGEVVRSTRERDLGRAIRRARDLERELLKLDPAYRPQTIGEVWEEVLDLRRIEWRTGSEKTAVQVVERNILPVFGSMSTDAMSDIRWAKFVKAFYAENPGKKLFNTRKYMLMIMNHAHQRGYTRIKLKLPISDAPEREGLFIPEDHYQRLLEACVNQDFCDDARFEKLHLFIEIGYWMGCRRFEILGLTRSRVNLSERSITFRPEDVKTGSKTGRGRTILIAPEVFPKLERWLETHPGEYLFPRRGENGPMKDNHCAWSRAIERAELPDYTPNDLRHTFFTRKIIIEKKPIIDCAIYGGTSVSVLESTYLHKRFEHTKTVVQDADFREQLTVVQ